VRALIRSGWSEGSFEPDIEQAILQNDAASLTAESDRARLDNLLWRGEITAAKRQVSGSMAGRAISQTPYRAHSYWLSEAQADVDKAANKRPQSCSSTGRVR
jgi:hypothetical protein